MNWKEIFGYKTILGVILIVPVVLIGLKLFVLKYPLASLIPVRSYRIDLSMQVDGHGEDIEVSTFIPRTDNRQVIGDEQQSSGPFIMNLLVEGENRTATWSADSLTGRNNIHYVFSVQSRHIRYEIPEKMPIPTYYLEPLKQYLTPTESIQVDDPAIGTTLRDILPGDSPGILESLRAIHRFLQDQLANKNFSGYTDALTALKLGEASCNGKSRLFIAMTRKLNLPSRLVGGLILAQGSKRITHQWVEVYVNGHWVPFDTINDHFAQIPSNFLTLYYGDQTMFRHTANVNFQYFYKMTKRMVPGQDGESTVQLSFLNIANLYGIFEKVGISQNLLKIIIMIPLGALVLSILRNVIGLETFGTFLPVLLAAAARETGLWWGILGILVIILLSALIRKGLDRLHLLHTPKMAIMLIMVIIIMMTMTVLGVNMGFLELAHVTLFPIAILAITAERFALIQDEQGFHQAMKILLVTIIAIAACYVAMDSLFLQSLILAFPELLLMIIALNLLLGRWIGIRVIEFIRFRRLIEENAR